MKVVFDATTLRPVQTGIGYYTEHLLHHLLQEAPDWDFHLISNRPVETSRPLESSARICSQGYFPSRYVWMQSAAPWLLSRLKPDLAHFTNLIAPILKTVPTVLTVHDMSLKMLPRFHPLRRRLIRPLQSAALKQADAVITVSESSKKDIVRLSSVPEAQIHVIHEAAAPDFRPIRDRQRLETVRNRYRLAQRVLLFVGTIEPRKNLGALIEAYAHLRRRYQAPHQLALVGLFGWGYREVKRKIEAEGLEREVLLCGYAPFEDLPALYNLAEIFVFPSFLEGFGLPVLEAMACGVPVVTSNHAAFVEVAGDAAAKADADDVESLVSHLKRLIDSQEERRRLAELGLQRAAEFSWQEAARQTMAVYRQVAG